MELTVHGVELDEVVSIYMIVGDEADLSDLDDARTVEKVVRPERQGKYVTFAQFKPKKDKNWVFTQSMLKPESPKVEVSLAGKAPDIKFEIGRGLLEAHPQLSAAVVVNCGARGWGAYPRISSSQIRSVDALKLEVRGSTISLAGTSKQAAVPTSVPK
jgi:hypothetical protein